MGIRIIALAALILIVAIFSWWIEDLTRQMGQTPPETEADIQDFFVTGYSINITDAEGRLQYQGSGERMDHWQKSQEVTLDKPVFIAHQEQGPPITLRADRAEGKPDGDEVFLRGEVMLDREAYDNNDSIHAVTRDMTLWRRAQRGHTDAPVKAVGQKYQVEGTGMSVDLLAGTLELHSKVRGVYEY